MKSPVHFLITAFCALTISSCQKAKETINKGGEAVGETATEFIEGVSEGVDRTLECKISLSEKRINEGIKTGKFYIEDEGNSKDNKLVIYIITEKALNDTLTFTVKDKKGVEFGCEKLVLNTKAGDASYYDVIFDARTDIEAKSTIEIY